MRLAHLADLHLGFRQYQRLTAAGINQREADVARAFQDAIDQVIALAPELVVVAGDLFHASRPPNNAIVHAHRQFVRLRAELPETVVVLVAGNHDAPRAVDTGNILALFEPLGIHVAASCAKRICVPQLGLSVLAVPDVAGPRPLLEPDAAARYNVLVVHGEVEHVAPAAEPCGWDYVALGHYHVQREMAPRMGYAGALDYTSSNPWGELAEERASGVPGKGFVTYDLEARTRAFHPVARPRAFVELPAIDGAEKEPAAIDALIRCAVERYEGGIEGKVVRLVVRDIPRATARGLDLRAIRALRARVLNFQLVLDRPSETIAVGTERTARRPLKSLADIVREGLAKRALPGDVDREALTALALKFLDTATERAEIGAVEPTEATA